MLINPKTTPTTDPPVDPDLRRRCPVRVIIPAYETDSPTATWTDVAFAYVRELAGSEVASLIRVVPGDLNGIDLRVASRWHPYTRMFYGVCPQPAEMGAEKPTFVNVVIGAGDLVENAWTFGAQNVVITGYGIPPYKIGWLTARIWDYDYIVAPSEKHGDKIFESCRSDAIRYVSVFAPKEGVKGLVDMIHLALSKCVPESERVY